MKDLAETTPIPATQLTNRKNRFDNEKCSVEYVVLNKEIVDDLLSGNLDNRKPTPSHMAKLSFDFKNGRYIFTGQPIIRDDFGFLRDGQHRLLAIREAGYPEVPMLIVTLHGDKSRVEQAYDRMDINKTRSYGQRLQHKKMEFAGKIAAMRRKITYLKTNFNSYPVVSDSIYDEIGQMYRIELEAIAPYVNGGFTADMGAAVCLIARATGCLDDCVSIVKHAKDGEMLKIGNPEHTLMKIINKSLRTDMRRQSRNAFQFAVVANCLIAALQGKKYPAADGNSAKACKWIIDTAAENEMPLLPRSMKNI